MTAIEVGRTTPDDEWKDALLLVTDPREALRIISDNEQILGGDPYYGDLVSALVAMADRLGAPLPQ